MGVIHGITKEATSLAAENSRNTHKMAIVGSIIRKTMMHNEYCILRSYINPFYRHVLLFRTVG